MDKCYSTNEEDFSHDFVDEAFDSILTWIKVSKEDFDHYINAYPRQLEKDVTGICEPPLLTYNDFSGGRKWPESIVAKVKLYNSSEYHGVRGPFYFLPNNQIN